MPRATKKSIPTKITLAAILKNNFTSSNRHNIIEVIWVGIPMPVGAVVYIEVPPNLELEVSADISALLDNNAKARIYR